MVRFTAFAATLLSLVSGTDPTPPVVDKEAPWTRVGVSDGILIENRERAGTSVKEVRATGVLRANAADLKAVVDDVGAFHEFVPFTTESKILERHVGYSIVYQKVDAPFLSVRDYAARVTDKTHVGPDGKTVFLSVWSKAPTQAPPKGEDVVRITVIDGHWRFVDVGDGKSSHVEYRLFTDPGGNIPAFVLNGANAQAFPRILRAIEERAQKQAAKRTVDEAKKRAATVETTTPSHR